VGKELYEAGLIRSGFAFKLYIQVRELTRKIMPGEYRIPGNVGLSEVVEILMEGPVEMWVTIPEGLRREQIPERFIDALGLEGDVAEEFYAQFMRASEGKEGYLFPDTYLFPADVSAAESVRKMSDTFDVKFGNRYKNGVGGLSLDEIVVLASIIERETVGEEERPVVAGIYLKRLDAGWSMDADATLQYAIASERCGRARESCEWWGGVLSSDKEVDSPYNTYRYAGLPPGPIASPGLVSLEAVTNPVESEYWFYLHDAEGKIHYAKTLEEQSENIRKYL